MLEKDRVVNFLFALETDRKNLNPKRKENCEHDLVLFIQFDMKCSNSFVNVPTHRKIFSKSY